MALEALVPPQGRGCGSRKSGAIYAEVGVGPNGMPVEHFLVDPPIKIDKAEYGLSDVGVKLVEREGVYHIFDIIGEAFYQVADYVEETRRFGASRRLPSTLDFSKLTADSRLILLHKRAWTDKFEEYAKDWVRVNKYNPCVKEPPIHGFVPNPSFNAGRFLFDLVVDGQPDDLCCLGFAWQDVEGGTPIPVSSDPKDTINARWFARGVVRKMPSFQYEAAKPPAVLVNPEDRGYHLAIFMSLPITRLAVVAGEKARESLAKAQAAKLSVEMVDA